MTLFVKLGATISRLSFGPSCTVFGFLVKPSVSENRLPFVAPLRAFPLSLLRARHAVPVSATSHNKAEYCMYCPPSKLPKY